MRTKKTDRRYHEQKERLIAGDNPQPQEIFTILEAAAYLRVGRKVIDAAIRQRRLPVIQLTRTQRALRIYKQDLLKLRAPVV